MHYNGGHYQAVFLPMHLRRGVCFNEIGARAYISPTPAFLLESYPLFRSVGLQHASSSQVYGRNFVLCNKKTASALQGGSRNLFTLNDFFVFFSTRSAVAAAVDWNMPLRQQTEISVEAPRTLSATQAAVRTGLTASGYTYIQGAC